MKEKATLSVLVNLDYKHLRVVFLQHANLKQFVEPLHGGLSALVRFGFEPFLMCLEQLSQKKFVGVVVKVQ
jgi:hypothetical protein